MSGRVSIFSYAPNRNQKKNHPQKWLPRSFVDFHLPSHWISNHFKGPSKEYFMILLRKIDHFYRQEKFSKYLLVDFILCFNQIQEKLSEKENINFLKGLLYFLRHQLLLKDPFIFFCTIKIFDYMIRFCGHYPQVLIHRSKLLLETIKITALRHAVMHEQTNKRACMAALDCLHAWAEAFPFESSLTENYSQQQQQQPQYSSGDNDNTTCCTDSVRERESVERKRFFFKGIRTPFRHSNRKMKQQSSNLLSNHRHSTQTEVLKKSNYAVLYEDFVEALRKKGLQCDHHKEKTESRLPILTIQTMETELDLDGDIPKLSKENSSVSEILTSSTAAPSTTRRKSSIVKLFSISSSWKKKNPTEQPTQRITVTDPVKVQQIPLPTMQEKNFLLLARQQQQLQSAYSRSSRYQTSCRRLLQKHQNELRVSISSYSSHGLRPEIQTTSDHVVDTLIQITTPNNSVADSEKREVESHSSIHNYENGVEEEEEEEDGLIEINDELTRMTIPSAKAVIRETLTSAVSPCQVSRPTTSPGGLFEGEKSIMITASSSPLSDLTKSMIVTLQQSSFCIDADTSAHMQIEEEVKSHSPKVGLVYCPETSTFMSPPTTPTESQYHPPQSQRDNIIPEDSSHFHYSTVLDPIEEEESYYYNDDQFVNENANILSPELFAAMTSPTIIMTSNDSSCVSPSSTIVFPLLLSDEITEEDVNTATDTENQLLLLENVVEKIEIPEVLHLNQSEEEPLLPKIPTDQTTSLELSLVHPIETELLPILLSPETSSESLKIVDSPEEAIAPIVPDVDVITITSLLVPSLVPRSYCSHHNNHQTQAVVVEGPVITATLETIEVKPQRRLSIQHYLTTTTAAASNSNNNNETNKSQKQEVEDIPTGIATTESLDLFSEFLSLPSPFSSNPASQNQQEEEEEKQEELEARDVKDEQLNDIKENDVEVLLIVAVEEEKSVICNDNNDLITDNILEDGRQAIISADAILTESSTIITTAEPSANTAAPEPDTQCHSLITAEKEVIELLELELIPTSDEDHPLLPEAEQTVVQRIATENPLVSDDDLESPLIAFFEADDMLKMDPTVVAAAEENQTEESLRREALPQTFATDGIMIMNQAREFESTETPTTTITTTTAIPSSLSETLTPPPIIITQPEEEEGMKAEDEELLAALSSLEDHLSAITATATSIPIIFSPTSSALFATTTDNNNNHTTIANQVQKPLRRSSIHRKRDGKRRRDKGGGKESEHVRQWLNKSQEENLEMNTLSLQPQDSSFTSPDLKKAKKTRPQKLYQETVVEKKMVMDAATIITVMSVHLDEIQLEEEVNVAEVKEVLPEITIKEKEEVITEEGELAMKGGDTTNTVIMPLQCDDVSLKEETEVKEIIPVETVVDLTEEGTALKNDDEEEKEESHLEPTNLVLVLKDAPEITSLSHLPPLQTLTLSRLSKLSSLETLNTSRLQSITIEACHAIQDFSPINNLHHVVIDNCKWFRNGYEVNAVRHLVIKYCKGLINVRMLGQGSIQHLELHYCENIASYAGLEKIPKVEILRDCESEEE